MSERLKAWLDEYQHGRDERLGPALRALRAVVDLHRLTPEMQWGNVCGHCFKDWPCPTIKAIEREVFGE